MVAAAGAHRVDGDGDGIHDGERQTLTRQRHRLARHVDERRLKSAIEAAESRTTGRIHVTLSHHFPGTTLDGAARAFRRLRLDDTPERNGVLFFVVPSRREFAVVGDEGINKRVGQTFWDALALAMTEAIRKGDLDAGLLAGIEVAGKELAAHFPRQGST